MGIIKRFHRKPRSVIEWFGGIGTCSRYVQSILEPDSWVICERDPDFVTDLSKKFDEATVIHCDSYSEAPIDASVLILDFDSWTLNHLKRITRALEGEAKWVVITDHAIQRIAINGPVSYSRTVEEPIVSFEDYLRGLDKLIKPYGYYVFYCVSHYAASKIVLRKGKRKPGQTFTWELLK